MKCECEKLKENTPNEALNQLAEVIIAGQSTLEELKKNVYEWCEIRTLLKIVSNNIKENL